MGRFFREALAACKEFGNCSAFSKLDRKYRRVVFYSENRDSYAYFEGLVNHLINEFDIPICYITSQSTDPLLERHHPNFRAFYIKYTLVNFIASLDADILVMTMPDLNLFHIKRSRNDTNHVYLFHNIGSAFSTLRFGALFHYDTIFCVGPHHREEIQRQEEKYGLGESCLVNSGYYKLEKVYQDYQRHRSTVNLNRVDTKRKGRVLLAPTWGENSILNLCGSQLIHILIKANYEVTVRPHVMTRDREQGLIKSLNREFAGFDNYTYEDDTASTESFYESDVLISDWSGVSYEYAFGTERPVLFIDVPQKVVNPRYKEIGIEPMDIGVRTLVGEVLGLSDLNRADDAIAMLMANRDTYVQEIRKAREKYIFNFGESSRAGAEYIRDFLMSRDKSGQQ